MNILRNIMFLVGEAKKYFWQVLIFLMALELGRVANNYFFAKLIDEVIATSTVSWFLLSCWLGIESIVWLFDGGADYFIVKLLVSVEYLVPLKSLKHLLTLSMRFFEDAGTGKVAKRIEKGTDGLTSLLESFCWEVVSSSIQFIITTIYLTTVLEWWGLILICMAPIFVGLTILLDHLKKELRKKRFDLYEESGHLLFQIMQNISLVKAFAKESDEQTRYEKVRKAIHDLSMREFRYEVSFNIIRGLLITFTLGGIFYVGVYFVSLDVLKVGSVVAAMNLSIAALFSLFRLTRIFIRFMDNYEAIERVVKFLQEQPEIKDTPDALVVEHLLGDVEFEHVHFSYSTGDADDCLVDLNFNIPAGKTVAIVGPSGSGKTTLINLLLRFMDPTCGVVSVGGHDIKTLSQTSYRNHLSVVLQDTTLFDRTLGDNVAEGLDVEDFTSVEPDVWWALERSHAIGFVKELPGGKELNTMIGERGVKLSGGQRQRIAIAAALIRKPSILILDEATSSLDTQSERAIQQAMRDIQEEGSTTVFVIAHRLSTIRDADIIMVLDKGRLVQIGSHEELIQNTSGLYASMVGIQSV